MSYRLVLALLLLAAPLRAQLCRTPAMQPAPELEIVGSGIAGDSTWYRFNYEPSCGTAARYPPFWFALAPDGAGRFIAATGSTVELRVVAPGAPLLSQLCKPVLGPWLKTDADYYATSVVMRGSVWALGLQGGMGVVIGKANAAGVLAIDYQDMSAGTVWTMALLDEAVLAALDTGELRVYPFPHVQHVPGGCLVDEQGGGACGTGSFRPLATASGPLRANRLVAGDGALFAIRPWATSDTRLYRLVAGVAQPIGAALGAAKDIAIRCFPYSCLVALVRGQETAVLQVLPDGALRQVAVVPTPGPVAPSIQLEENRAQWSAEAMLWVGTTITPGVGQREYWFDFANPDRPLEITLPAGYFRSYYRDEGGFCSTAPYASFLEGNALVRSVWSILETHTLAPSAALWRTGFELYDALTTE